MLALLPNLCDDRVRVRAHDARVQLNVGHSVYVHAADVVAV